mgnify:CR=1 FL=1
MTGARRWWERDDLGYRGGRLTFGGRDLAAIFMADPASFDPNGLPLTGFQWTQIGLPAVTLSTPTAAVTTFA